MTSRTTIGKNEYQRLPWFPYWHSLGHSPYGFETGPPSNQNMRQNQRKIKGVKGQRGEASGQTKAESSAKNHETAENSR